MSIRTLKLSIAFTKNTCDGMSKRSLSSFPSNSNNHTPGVNSSNGISDSETRVYVRRRLKKNAQVQEKELQIEPHVDTERCSPPNIEDFAYKRTKESCGSRKSKPPLDPLPTKIKVSNPIRQKGIAERELVRSIKNNTKGVRKDPAWKYGTEVQEGRIGKSYIYIKWNFCNKVVKGGVKRMKDHLGCTRKNVAPCNKVPDEVKQEMQEYLQKGEMEKFTSQKQFEEMVETVGEGSSSGNFSLRGIRGPMDGFIVVNDDDDNDGNKVDNRVNPVDAEEARNAVCMDIGNFFVENGIPFNVARSPSFVNMCQSIGLYGQGLKPPSMYELSSWILKEEMKTTNDIVNDIRKTWVKTGVSILSDGWKDMRGKSFINFLVNSPSGTIFLRSIDASEAVKDENMLFHLLDDIVEEVGAELVVQIVTDNGSHYKSAGQKLMEKRKNLYWSPCAAHCLDLMLEQLSELPQHKKALIKAKKVSNFIYNHGWVLALMRTFTKRELICPATTRFSTAYLTLQNVYQSKEPLQAMFTSKQWQDSVWAKYPEGKEVKKIILSEKHFWLSVLYAIKTTTPLVSVLRLVNSEKVPVMGFIYGAIDSAKEEIAKNLGGEEANYKEIWDIIDEKWEFQLHQHLHAAAYFLNPHFQYDDNFSSHPEIKFGLYTCMDKLIPNEDERTKADLQIDIFRRREGFFGFRQAKISCKKRSPVDWWTQFGDGTPELTKFAIKVLSLTCSTSRCERDWSAFNQVHTKKRNRLSTTKLNNLVYIMYNKRLKNRHLKQKVLQEEEDPLVLDDVPSDDEWIAENSSDGRVDRFIENDDDYNLNLFKYGEGSST